MRIYRGESISKSYGEKVLFQGINFSIGEKERIGLIGINGTGKSTLLKIIAQKEEADSGRFEHPKDYKITLLDQQPIFNNDATILEQVLSIDDEINKLIHQYEKTLIELNNCPNDRNIQDRLFHLQAKMDQRNAWERNAKVKSILTKLGLHDFNQKISHLSGGQKKRVALAQVLIQEVDLLILDEPTNHLDYELIQWLQEELQTYKGSVLFVTHDRYFLDQTANKIFELTSGKLYEYPGNYQAYLEAKATRELVEAKQFEKQKSLYKKELEWIRRGAKARTTKQKARIQRFEQLEENLSNQIQKETLEISLSSKRLGKQVIEMKNGYKKYDSKKILEDFNLIVQQNDRIGIVGQNGSGKSTFLNIIAGKETLDHGMITIGQTVKMAYYRQQTEDIVDKKRVIEYLKETSEVIKTIDGTMISASQMLERFLFPSYMHGVPIYKLSGGEKKRLYLLKLLMEQPNVLLLDEPTNDLDTETLTVLEDYLDQFSGVVITVSHDRYFLDKVCDQLLIFSGDGKIEKYYGSYTDYLNTNTKKEKKVNKEEKAIPAQQEKKKKKKLSFKEQKEWEEIHDRIALLEKEIEQLQDEITKEVTNYEKLQQLMKEADEKNKQLEELIERWTYLAEIMEQQ